MIYLDHAATTPLDPDVWQAMQPYCTEYWGNPTSIYSFGQQARAGIDTAREEVAAVLQCDPMEIIFTSGGTESNNLAIKGLADMRKKGHIITTNIEHHAVLHPIERLEQHGFEVTRVPVEPNGIVDPKKIEAALRDDTILVSVMYVNNEIGTIQPIAEIGALCRERDVYFHTDAVQAAGELPLNVADLNVDMLTLTAHKFYGPKGAGCLYVRNGIQLVPQLEGGGQEHRNRASTENVPAIVGMGKALVKAEQLRETEHTRLVELRDSFIEKLSAGIEGVTLNGDPVQRSANNVNVRIADLEGEPMLLRLDFAGICASAGSACTSGSMEASHVIAALGVDSGDATGSLRFTLGRSTTQAELDTTVETLKKIVAELRTMSTL